MAGNIKGIQIEFSADVTKLNSGLKDIQGTISKTQKELRQVDKALKFKPGNTTLLQQKFQLLKQNVEQTRQKLDQLKKVQAQMDAEGVDKNSAEYRQLQREIIKTEDQLKQAEGELKRFGSVGKQQALAVSRAFKNVGSKISSAGQTMTMRVTAPLVAGFTAASKYASDFEENMNKLDVAFGSSSKAVKNWANNASASFGLSRVQASESAAAFGALGKGIGLSEKEAADMSTTLAGLSADLGSYFNVGVDESAKALEGIFTGESEALKKFGVVMTDTNLQQFAEDQGLVWKEMSQAEKTALRYNYVLAKTKDAQGDFARTNDGTANSIKMFQATVQDLGVAVGTVLLPIITPIIQKITELIGKFNELSPTTQKIITIIGMVVAAVGPLLIVVGSVISAVGTIIGVFAQLGPIITGVKAAFTFLTGPIGLVIAAIAAAIAIGIALYKNWDKIKAKLTAIWKTIKTVCVNTWNAIKAAIVNKINEAKARLFAVVTAMKTFAINAFNGIKSRASAIFNAVKTAITHPIETAKNIIKRIIDKIKGFFSFSISPPHIPLPHFAISPPGWKLSDLLKGSKPSLSIDWYAKGGIFNRPTIAGIGERGAEAVVPLNKFWNKLDHLSGETNIVINVTATPGMDETRLAREIKRTLISEVKSQKRAWA